MKRCHNVSNLTALFSNWFESHGMKIPGSGTPCGYLHRFRLQRGPSILGTPIANSARTISSILPACFPFSLRLEELVTGLVMVHLWIASGHNQFKNTTFTTPITKIFEVYLSPSTFSDCQRLRDARIGSLNFTASLPTDRHLARTDPENSAF